MTVTNFINFVWQNAVGFGVLNTVMFVGFIVFFGIWSLGFYAHGTAMNIHDYYDLPKKKWYQAINGITGLCFSLWTIAYVLIMLITSIGLTQVCCTYVAAIIIAFLGAMGITLVYQVVYYCIVFPVELICRLFKRK